MAVTLFGDISIFGPITAKGSFHNQKNGASLATGILRFLSAYMAHNENWNCRYSKDCRKNCRP